jgi:carboxylate-amine ligase
MVISGYAHAPMSARQHEGEPRWARWKGGAGGRYTVGVEEEVMLLEPADWSLAQRSDEVLARLSPELIAHASPETHAGVLELTTGVHQNAHAAVGELAALRRRFRRELRPMSLAPAVAGTHPLTVWEETEISGAHRYRQLNGALRVLARREPTMALHVHVGVPAPEDAVNLLNRFRHHAPILLALAANSPFWQGRDGGLASARTMIFQAFPRTGLPRAFVNYADYVAAVDELISPGAIPDPSYLWWDVRLQPALGTIELRVMDAQSTIEDVAALVALIQSLARLELEQSPPPPLLGAEALAENRFLAARDGMAARLIDPTAQRLVPVRDLLDPLLERCRPHAIDLGCAVALDQVQELMRSNGADRQRALAVGHGDLKPVARDLAGLFVTPHQALAGRRERP